MAITQVGSATSATSANGASVAVTKPTGTASGDVIIAFGCTTETTPYFDTVPSGFTQFESSAVGDTPNLFQGTAWYKVCGGAEPASYTFGSAGAAGAGAPLVVGMATFRGVNTTTPIDDSAEVAATSSGEPANPSITATQTASGRLFFARMVRTANSTVPTFTSATSGWSEILDVGRNSGGTVSYGIGLYRQDNDTGAGARTEPAVTCSTTETDNVYVLGALKAAADPSSGSFSMQLSSVTEAASGEVHDDATMAMQLGGVTEAFEALSLVDGEAVMAMQLGGVGADLAAESAPAGDAELQLSPVTTDWAASVEPIGDFGLQLSSVGAAFVGETVPFGQHVIVIDAEERAFLVIEGDPGLISMHARKVNYPPNNAHLHMSLQSVSIDVAAAIISGNLSATLQPVTMAFSGVSISGGMQMTLPSVGMAVDAKKVNIVYAVDIGNGSLTSFTVTHNLGSKDVLTAVYETASPYEEVQPTSIERTTTNTITVTFPSAPTTNQYRVVVVYG